MATHTNRIRTTLDALEAREMCWAGLPGLPLGGLSPIVHLGPVTPPVHRLQVADAVFTLANGTSHALTLTVRWEGAAAAHSITLMPGQSQRIWVREVERFWLQTAVVRVDGGQEAFRVRSALTAEGPNGPVGAGPVYTLQPGPAASVALHPSSSKPAPRMGI